MAAFKGAFDAVFSESKWDVVLGAEIAVRQDRPRYIWSSSLSINPFQVFFDSTRGTIAEDAVSVDSEFEWYWNDGDDKLYVYCNRNLRLSGDPVGLDLVGAFVA